jgi:hypothetical protein
MTRPDPQPILRMVDITAPTAGARPPYTRCVASPCTSYPASW